MGPTGKFSFPIKFSGKIERIKENVDSKCLSTYSQRACVVSLITNAIIIHKKKIAIAASIFCFKGVLG